jgi:hypothetical protein
MLIYIKSEHDAQMKSKTYDKKNYLSLLIINTVNRTEETLSLSADIFCQSTGSEKNSFIFLKNFIFKKFLYIDSK